MLTFLPYLAGFVLGGAVGYLAGSIAGDIRLSKAYRDNALELDDIVRRLNLP